MKICYLLLLLACIKATFTAKVVCYYGSWAIYNKGHYAVHPEHLDYHTCTHLNYAFADLKADGNLKVADHEADIAQKGYIRTTALKKKNPKLKVILSIGPNSHWRKIAGDPHKRAILVKSARQFVEKYHFDGIDLDWEVPKKQDKKNFVALLQEFRKDFDRNGWIVSAAVSATPSDGYDVPKMSKLLDYINLMTYDMYGAEWSEYTGQNSPLYPSSVENDWERKNLNVAASVKNWLKLGVDSKKLCVGIAFYGRTFTLADPKKNGLHAKFSGPGKPGPVEHIKGEMSYLDICLSKWKCHWDNEQKNPICVNGNQWLGSDNARSIREKVNYIKKHKLGGVMIWSVDQDDVHGSCGSPNPLITTVRDALK